MATTIAEPRMSRSDRAAMYATVGFALVGIIAIGWGVVARLIEVFPGTDVPVLVPFIGEHADLPIGPDGAAVDVAVAQAVVTVPRPAGATLFAVYAQPIVSGAAAIAVIALLAVFAWNIARGRAFSRANVRIVWAATFILMAGWVLGSLFTTMTVNGALSAVSEYTYEGVLFSTDWMAFWGIIALGAVGGAFQIGERLRRDTEGLV